ncbi:hypothetical protein BH11PLA2_BH11PLA2_08970 [soil metagenome]
MKVTVTETLLQQAAELRAAGRTWESVARTMNRTAKRVRNWPSEHRVRWQRFFAEAEAALMKEAEHESMTALRSLLRKEDDDKTVKDAATALLRHKTANRKNLAKKSPKKSKAATAAVKLAEYVEGLSDAELEHHLRELDSTVAASSEASPAAAPAVAVDPQSPA